MGTHPIFESDFDCLTAFQRRVMSGRHDSRKRGRSRSPDRSRSGRSVSSKSRSGRSDHRRDDNFKLPEPKTAEDKLTRILQGNTPRPQNEGLIEKEKKEEKKDAMTPLSLEEIIDAKKAKEEELSKPKFLTKAERAQLALERRQKEAEEKRRQMDELRAKQKQIFQQGRIQNDPAEERRQRRKREEESRH